MKQVVLVAGVDYEFKGVDFRVFCENRMKRLIASNKKKEDLTFILFDVLKGEQVTREVTFPGGKQTIKATPLSPSPFHAVTKANYNRTVVDGEAHYRFKDGQSGIVSAQDIYKAIRNIGRSAPNTLIEVSVFSHGWMGGPILVNSFDDGIATTMVAGVGPVSFVLPSAARDPDDMDPRGAKDFIAPTMDPAALTELKNAFHSDAIIWLWGCAFPRLVHEILHKIEHHASYKDSGLGDEEMFRITNFNTEQAQTLENWIASDLGGPFPDRKRIEIKFKFLKLFFNKIVSASYAQHLANAANVKVFAALMGTYADYDAGPLRLMSIFKGFARHFKFYQSYLGFGFDPEGRKYGAYLPGRTFPVPGP
ncbi:MAG: hypothetical protein ABUT39_04965 [Acidobacteriota bacterium]